MDDEHRSPGQDPVTTERVLVFRLVAGPDGRTPPPIYVDQLGALINRTHPGVPLEVLGFSTRFDKLTADVEFDDVWRDPETAVGKYAVLLFPGMVVRTSIHVTGAASGLTAYHPAR